MCQIGDVLLSLQRHGNDQYMDWQMKCQCRTPDIVDQLQTMASGMETDLGKWKDEVQDTRGKFYQLNYFTTQQLLQLRRELGRFKDPSNRGTIKPQVMALLQSISRDITSDVVIGHLEAAEQREMQHKPTSLSGTNVRVVEQRMISEDHNVVRELQLAGYDLTDCIEAVTKCHDDAEQAMQYLMSRNQDFDSQGEPLQSLDMLSEPMDVVGHEEGMASVDAIR